MKKKISLYFMTVIILMLVLFEGVFSVAIYRYYYNGLLHYVESHAKASTKFFSDYNSVYDLRLREYSGDIISSFQLQGTELQLLDRYGNVIQSSNGYKVNKKVRIPLLVLEGDTYHRIANQKSDGKSLEVLSPFIHKGQTIGVLKYTTNLKDVNQRIIDIILGTVLMGIIISIIVLIVSKHLANLFIKPIHSIINASSEIAKGTLTCKINEDYPGELGELAHSLNHMVSKINQSTNMKNEFIASISHELRTPLTGIKGWSETLATFECLTDKEIKQGMSIITAETDRLIHLVENLLDFSKLELDYQDLCKEKFFLQDLLNESIWQLETKAKQREIKIVTEFEEVELIADRARLKQVFLNIIDNAIKYSNHKGRIEVTLLKQEQIIISISDQGIGIAEEHLPYINEFFYQVNSKSSGSGMGLAIVKKIVKLHNGLIQIDSEEGIGTTVTIKLPF
ncbi:HAMP domain-containing sensor histidine kinase [Bacillus albus]|uniref:HAMP domain-containing sensor histidine kinase n=1 Tax=Bacillus cereus group TaxID=86661 RepID=UPI001C10765B|nr:HAMP domain-containing sensor histidine kinase [Bacillus albus]MBU5220712.1 HAMP domain-containing histidine kinase [Bacillus albus]MCU4836760.1 HAMP domain-containing histidine kinase [Bacillus cereus]